MRSFNNHVSQPFRSLSQFAALRRRLYPDLNEPRVNRPWSPAVDIYETENELVLKADLPDVEPKDIDVRVENQTLTIAGERKFEKKEDNKGFHRIERSYGELRPQLRRAQYVRHRKDWRRVQNGVLSVTLPKKEAAKPRQIKVEVKA